MSLENISSSNYINDKEINCLSNKLKEAKQNKDSLEITKISKEIRAKILRHIKTQNIIYRTLESHGQKGLEALSVDLNTIICCTDDKGCPECIEHIEMKKAIDLILNK